MKLGEENRRRKSTGPPPKPVRLQYNTPAEASSGQHVGHSDDDSSIIAQPSKTPSCGACRTRESKTWWKAPKGLSTNILCDTCGSNWRKYADLNVRPLREESVPTTKAREKREGTPLAGPSTKRPRVSPYRMRETPPLLSLYCRQLHLRILLRHLRYRLLHKIGVSGVRKPGLQEKY